MKNKIIIIALTAALLLSFGCSQKSQDYPEAGYSQRVRTSAVMESASVSSQTWVGTGFNENAPAFRDMSNLYGQANLDSSYDENDGATEAANMSNVERKLVKRANVRIRVENLDAADVSIAELLNKYDAYSASTNVEENSRYYSLRVPAQYYDIFLSEMNGMGRLLGRHESTEDVTLRYYDLEGRLATKKELLRTFQAYLRRANNIEEILAVEARISELQYDIEGTGIQLRNLANRVDYATIELSLLGPVTVTATRTITLSERMKQLFGGFGGFLSTMVIVIIGIVVYGIPIFAVVALLFWLFFGKIGLLKRLWRVIRK
jgi:hypothetical protein